MLVFLLGCFAQPSERIPYDVEVANMKGVGIVGDTDALHFGRLASTYSSTRFITVTNTNEKECTFRLSATGFAAQWLDFEKEFLLESAETKEVKIKMAIPEGTGDGFYNGEVLVFVECYGMLNK